ncbi:threonine dehydratase [Bradyrhizobium sp. JR6.1]
MDCLPIDRSDLMTTAANALRDYAQRILTARVYDVAIETPLDPMPRLSERLSRAVLLKREDFQPIFSFKLRGAYNKIVRLPDAQRRQGVICASAGNHAQGVALAARKLGIPATIVMPRTTPAIKVEAVRRLGGDVVLHGDTFDDAQTKAREIEVARGLTFVHPFDDPDVIAGQGTVGMEILRQHPDPIEAIFVPIGGGGLAAGVAAFVKFLNPSIKVVGVEPADAASMAAALAKGNVVALDQVGLFADGVAVRKVGAETFRLCRDLLDEVVTVDTDAMCAAIKDIFDDVRSVAEPSGALALAGLKAYAERGALSDGKPDCRQQRRQSEFRPAAHHRRSRRGRRTSGGAACGNRAGEAGQLSALHPYPRFAGHHGIQLPLCRDDGAGAALRRYRAEPWRGREAGSHGAAPARGLSDPGSERERDGQGPCALHGGWSRAASQGRGDLPLRVSGASRRIAEIPREPGARLEHFAVPLPKSRRRLRKRILAGIEVKPSERARFVQALDALGYPYWNESENPAYRLFLSAEKG